jgi:hypothetical protein
MIVVHSDLEQWLCGWLRGRLPAFGINPSWVSNAERSSTAGGAPNAPGELHIIIRVDAGPEGDVGMKDSTIGVTVIGPNRAALKPTGDAARMIVALIKGETPEAVSPIANVQVTSGPYTVPSSNDEARYYAVLEATSVGTQHQ